MADNTNREIELISTGRQHLHTFGCIWKNPHKSPQDIVAFQTRKMRSVIAYAYDNIEYYRKLFDRSRIKPQDIRTIQDLSIIPVTSSQDYRIRPLKETLSRKIRPAKTVCRATSGSSGRPFIIRRTFIEDHLLNFFRIRAAQQFGVRISDKLARIRLISRSHQRENIAGRIRQALGIYRDYPIDSLQTAQKTIRELTALQPDVIGGYPSVLAHIALHKAEQNDSNFNYRFIISGGESLPPFRRRKIEQGFGRRVFDLYGAHEFNLLAWQCRDSDWYHICDDNVILEILRNGRPAAVGERGEVVATGLHGYAMPFIRYGLGDIVTRGPETCSCGQPFSTLGAIQGRMHDYFRFSGGRLIHPDELIVPIMEDESSWFDRYRLVQEKENLVVLTIQPFRSPGEGQLNRVKKLADKVLPADVEFQVNIVENLLVESGGKFRFCRSMVNSDCDDINWQDL